MSSYAYALSDGGNEDVGFPTGQGDTELILYDDTLGQVWVDRAKSPSGVPNPLSEADKISHRAKANALRAKLLDPARMAKIKVTTGTSPKGQTFTLFDRETNLSLSTFTLPPGFAVPPPVVKPPLDNATINALRAIQVDAQRVVNALGAILKP